MRKLTRNEIRFIKETGWTPTLFQMDYSKEELAKTPYKNLNSADAIKEMQKKEEELNIDIVALYEKCVEFSDSISLDYEITYLLYTFFSPDEIYDMDLSFLNKWLKDFKYFFGYRKFEASEHNIEEALEIYNGTREFYETDDDHDMWNRKTEQEKHSFMLDQETNMYDLCYCMANCKKACARKKIPAGIHTVSDFTNICSEFEEESK